MLQHLIAEIQYSHCWWRAVGHWQCMSEEIMQNLYLMKTSGNRTTGSRCNSLVGQALWHPSESCQVLILTLWILGQTLTTATSTASFIWNPSIIRWLVYSLFKLTHLSCEDHTQLINRMGTLSKQYWTFYSSNSATMVNLW